MGYYTRVLSKDEAFPPFDELAQLVRTEHPDFKLSIEEGTEEEWETLLLSSNDEVEVALIERNPVADGSMGQDEVAEFMEETQECMPETGVAWLHVLLKSFEHHFAGMKKVSIHRIIDVSRKLLFADVFVEMIRYRQRREQSLDRLRWMRLQSQLF